MERICFCGFNSYLNLFLGTGIVVSLFMAQVLHGQLPIDRSRVLSQPFAILVGNRNCIHESSEELCIWYLFPLKSVKYLPESKMKDNIVVHLPIKVVHNTMVQLEQPNNIQILLDSGKKAFVPQALSALAQCIVSILRNM